MEEVLDIIQRGDAATAEGKGKGKAAPPGPPPPPGPAKGLAKGNYRERQRAGLLRANVPAGEGKGKPKGNAFTTWRASSHPSQAVLCNGSRLRCLESDLGCTFWIDRERWSTIEEFAQAMKVKEDARPSFRANLISAREQGRYLKDVVVEVPKAARVESYDPLTTMYVAAHARFYQDEEAKEALLRTRDQELTSSRAGDWLAESLWMDWYVKVLQRLREEFRPEGDRNDVLLQELRSNFAAQGFDEGSTAERVHSIATEFESLGQPIELHATSMSGETVTVEALPIQDLADLKDLLVPQMPGSEARRMMILLDGNELTGDTSSLMSFGLQNGSEFQVLMNGERIYGGGVNSGLARENLLADIRRVAATLTPTDQELTGRRAIRR